MSFEESVRHFYLGEQVHFSNFYKGISGPKEVEKGKNASSQTTLEAVAVIQVR